MAGPYWSKAWNPVWGCSPVSPGCVNCYARTMHERFHDEPFSKVTLHPERLSIPLRTRKPQVFFTDMCDPFHEAVPFEFLADMWHVMTGEADARPAPEHVYLILTKRPQRMLDFFAWVAQGGAGRPQDDALRDMMRHQGPHPRVWLGVTAEDQQRADERIPLLLQTPAAHRWVSVEPLLSDIDFDKPRCDSCGEAADCVGDDGATPFCNEHEQECSYGHWLDTLNGGIEQVIVGGESGSKARPCDADWIRAIVRQCKVAEVPCFAKQLGSNAFDRTVWVEGRFAGGVTRRTKSRAGSDPAEWPEDLRVRELAWALPEEHRP